MQLIYKSWLNCYMFWRQTFILRELQTQWILRTNASTSIVQYLILGYSNIKIINYKMISIYSVYSFVFENPEDGITVQKIVGVS